MKKKINAKELVAKIAELARERMASGPVVSLEDFKDLSLKKIPPTILVIEDDDIMRKSLQRIFESEGYRVLVASGGLELSEVLFETAIDLIVMDVGLPWLNGYELAKLMKEQKDLSLVPIVFISGNNDMDSVKRGFSVGAHDYITKPFDIAKVKKTINALLQISLPG